MEKETLSEYVNNKLSTYDISKKENKSQTTVRYWLKKYNLKTNPFNLNKEGFKVCPRCKNEKERSEFYGKRGKDGYSTYCKICSNDQVTERINKFKIKCVEYKGGKCVNCGYNKYIGALEFHHTDPNKKDYTIAKKSTYKFDIKTTNELDKCILLCANCHREIHNQLRIERLHS